jgi:DNA polymerase-4
MAGLCRDCLARADRPRCPACGSARVVRHAELFDLSIAHIDCDAFYASIEKRDDPFLRDKPVIVGGGTRGVVSAACYIARTYGVRSAMPMFKALRACPDAVVVRPDMDKYAVVGRQVRAIFLAYTPAVEPLSLDEAFLDLSGTEVLHRQPPAMTLATIIRRIEQEIGVTASVGLSYNKFLAKVCSDLDKPRGFAVLGRAEAVDFLARQPVGVIWGAGKALQARLAADGIRTCAQLQQRDEVDLMKRYGVIGRRLYRFARGEDDRRVSPDRGMKSVSAETTFEHDIADPEALRRVLWRLSEKVSRRLKASGLAGGTVVLKLKTADFRLRTRNHKLGQPTQLADVLYRHGTALLNREADGTRFRLLGIGVAGIEGADGAEAGADLADPAQARRAVAERAMDALRDRFGRDAIGKGRGLKG